MSATEVKITLSGGPTGLTADRSIPATQLDRVLKILHLGGYEHFVNAGECRTVDGCDIAVFRWTTRTKIAE